MTKEEIIYLSEILKAYGEGKTVQIRNKGYKSWSDLKEGNDCWDMTRYEFRVKPVSRYSPYTNAEEFLKAQKKHGPYVYFKNYKTKYHFPMSILDLGIVLYSGISGVSYTYEQILSDINWQDGTPCGKFVEEE